MSIRWIGRLTLMAASFVVADAAMVSAAGPSLRGKPAALDFTKGDKPGESHDWNLGASGARGWNEKTKRRLLDAFDDAIKTIESDKSPPKLRSAKDVVRGSG